jgi:malate dehydrogenase
MAKIALVGFGGIGIEAAKVIIQDAALTSDIVAYDRKEAIDAVPGPQVGAYEEILDAIGIMQTGHTISLTSNLDDIKDADVVIFTAGLPRKAGMSRADLIGANTEVVGPIAEKIKEVAPESFLIMVTNPLDAMVELAFRKTGFDPSKIVGQAGVLDTGRLTIEASLASKVPASQIQAIVLGGHGPQMVPVYSQTKVAGQHLSNYISQGEMDEISARVADRGATIIKRQGRSAVFSTALAAVKMAKAYLLNERKLMPAAARLSGQYGVNDLFVGVMTEISSDGIKIIEVPMDDKEKELFNKSVEATKDIVNDLP